MWHDDRKTTKNWMVRQLDEVVFWLSQLGDDGVFQPRQLVEVCMVEKQGVVCHWNEDMSQVFDIRLLHQCKE